MALGQVAGDRAGNCRGCLGVALLQAVPGEVGKGDTVVLVAMRPGGHVWGAREQVALVVVATAVGQNQILNGVDAAPDTWNEVISIRHYPERHPAVKAAVVLQGREAVSECLRGNQPGQNRTSDGGGPAPSWLYR